MRIFYDSISDLPSGGGEREGAQPVKLLVNILPHDEKNWYPAFCDTCGWFGSSEYLESHAIADTGDYSDPTCPICGHFCDGGASNDMSIDEIFEAIRRSRNHIANLNKEVTKLTDELYFSKRQSEIDSLREELETQKEKSWNWQDGYNKATEENAALLKEIDSLKEQLSTSERLRAEDGLSASKEIGQLKEQNQKLREVLQELIRLKKMKDLDGETPYYKDRKPKAWATAKALLNQQP